jgi:hypothetical protein
MNYPFNHFIDLVALDYLFHLFLDFKVNKMVFLQQKEV